MVNKRPKALIVLAIITGLLLLANGFTFVYKSIIYAIHDDTMAAFSIDFQDFDVKHCKSEMLDYINSLDQKPLADFELEKRDEIVRNILYHSEFIISFNWSKEEIRIDDILFTYLRIIKYPHPVVPIEYSAFIETMPDCTNTKEVYSHIGKFLTDLVGNSTLSPEYQQMVDKVSIRYKDPTYFNKPVGESYRKKLERMIDESQ